MQYKRKESMKLLTICRISLPDGPRKAKCLTRWSLRRLFETLCLVWSSNLSLLSTLTPRYLALSLLIGVPARIIFPTSGAVFCQELFAQLETQGHTSLWLPCLALSGAGSPYCLGWKLKNMRYGSSALLSLENRWTTQDHMTVMWLHSVHIHL